MKVNGIEIKAKKFAYDGCHKIYLLENEKEEEDALDKAYYIMSIKYLKDAFKNSCDLRFIAYWNLKKPYVIRQGDYTMEQEIKGIEPKFEE